MLLYPTTCASCRREIALTDRPKCIMVGGVIVSCPQCKTTVPTNRPSYALTPADKRFLRSLRIAQ